MIIFFFPSIEFRYIRFLSLQLLLLLLLLFLLLATTSISTVLNTTTTAHSFIHSFICSFLVDRQRESVVVFWCWFASHIFILVSLIGLWCSTLKETNASHLCLLVNMSIWCFISLNLHYRYLAVDWCRVLV